MGKLGLNGLVAGGAAVELRFRDAIPGSRPKERELYHLHVNNDRGVKFKIFDQLA